MASVRAVPLPGGNGRAWHPRTANPAKRRLFAGVSRLNLWAATPWLIRRSISAPVAALGPGLLLGRRFRRTYCFVREAERWSTDRAREYQLERLREVCVNAYNNSRYYRESFRKAGFEPGDLKNLEDLRGLPLIDKSTVRASLEEMCTVGPMAWGVESTTTSGTSGQPLQFYIGTNRSAIEYAYLQASWARTGYDMHTPMAVFQSSVVPENRHGLRHRYDPLLKRHYYSNFHMSDDHMHRYLEHIRGIGPCYLYVYPSAVAMLARFVRDGRVRPPENIRGIIAESEIVFPEQRRFIEDVFGCRYFSCYGHTEKLVAAAECEASNDYHVWPTYGYFELLDERGDSVTEPGKRGEIVGTGFINTVMPFIRYRTGDFATYVGDRCSACGREHVLIRDIRGHRIHEFLVARGGHTISWTSLNMHDGTFHNVHKFQFLQDTLGQVVLRIVPGDRFDDSDRKRILHNLERKLDGQIAISLETVREIASSPRGKAIYVDQRLPTRHLME